MLPAVAQGAVGIETRADDARARDMVARINDTISEIAVAAERGFLAALDGSCRTPLAGYATVEGAQIAFRGMALTPDGAQVFETSRDGAAADAARLGTDAGEEVRRTGGAALTF
jgi:hydroxymethylbilane synthase